MARIGVLGGTFDPIHVGHLMMAHEAHAQLGLDFVYLIPGGRPPHKGGVSFCPAEQRFRMVQLACENEPAFVPLRLEVDRDGPSYAIETLKVLSRGMDEQDELYFIIGSDAFEELDSWRNAGELIRLCRFGVALREGSGPMKRWPDSCPAEKADFIRVPRLDISSTEIRRRIDCGEPFTYMVPPAVAGYIRQNNLYR